MSSPASEPLARRLARARADRRLPSVAAAVFRDGEVAWTQALGLDDVEAGREATP